jgi:putative hydrolase of the HAD superfamily
VWQAVIFDGDDTLWRTEQLYDAARRRARDIVQSAGLDGARWEALERRRDVENVARLGHTRARFPTSCVEAYRQLCSELGRESIPTVAAKIEDAARTAFERSAPLVPQAQEALARLKADGIRLALLTKGDRELQLRRIEQSRLEPFFEVVQIVHEKTPESIASVVDRLGVAAEATLSVGNSIRSDVLPSLAAGVQPIWIEAHVWEYEHGDERPDERVIQIESLSQLAEMVLCR